MAVVRAAVGAAVAVAVTDERGARDMTHWITRLAAAALLSATAALVAHPARAADYATPDDAVAALESALKSDSVTALDDVFGPGSEKLLRSGDPVSDHDARQRLLTAFEAAHHLDTTAPDQRTLVVGQNDWPLPIPLVQTNGRWHFDSIAGAQEIIDRRIGENELQTIRALLAVADAQKDFFDRAKQAGGSGVYAKRFISSDGAHDGLFWPVGDDETPSPLAPLAELADQEGYSMALLQSGPVAFQGYHFRMLTAQGPDAVGGAKPYLNGGKLTGGYAVLAWPAQFGASGVMTFQMGPDGIVYQKDLGPETADIATHMTRFDPDLSWARIDITD